VEEHRSPSSKRIFISYRRDDSAAYAGRLYDRLAERFGDQQVFMDVDSIEPGIDFEVAIAQAVGSCQVALALIGRRWLTVTDDEGKRRLDDPTDIVRLELEAALNRNIRIIPVLLDGVTVPQREELPGSLAALSRRNAFRLSHEGFRSEVSRLLEFIEQAMGSYASSHAVVESMEPISGVATSPPDPQAVLKGVPAAFWGSWEGTISEFAFYKYPAVLTLHDCGRDSIAGESSYPTLGCRGNLRLHEVQQSRIILKEEIVQTKGMFGRLRCGSGMCELQLTGEGKVFASWSLGAKGELFRRK
jgi:hypothetical protein